MKRKQRVVVFFDVDNTLLDNDRVTKDIAARLDKTVGKRACKRYWELYEEIRAEVGYADYLAALQRFRTEDMYDPKLLHLSLFLTDYPFANRLFPGALDAVEHAGTIGEPVILTDGDVVFQPRKIFRSGLLDVFEGRALIYIHKEQELDKVEKLHPADHYVMLDDKLRILAAMKKIWGAKLTTVFIRQGHYAHEPGLAAKYPPPDMTLERISDFTALSREQLILAGYHK